MTEVSPWRQYAGRVIRIAIQECKSSDPKVIKKAISDSYPFGQRANHPYQIWLSEVKKALEELGIEKGENGPINLGSQHSCKWCKDREAGCLICLNQRKKVEQSCKQ